MKKEKTIEIKIGVTQEIIDKCRQLSEKHECDIEEIYKDAISLYANFDSHLMPSVTSLAFKYKVGESKIIQNIIIRYFAEQMAREEVFGETERFVPEFLIINNKPYTGIDLFETLKRNFINQFEEKSNNRLTRIVNALKSNNKNTKIKLYGPKIGQDNYCKFDNGIEVYWQEESEVRKPKFNEITLDLEQLKKENKIPQCYNVDALLADDILLDNIINEKQKRN